jgi:hypothetical protein
MARLSRSSFFQQQILHQQRAGREGDLPAQCE